MRANGRNSTESNIVREGTSGWVLIFLLVVGMPWGIWSFAFLLGESGSDSVAFVAAAGWFVLLATVYLGLHGLKRLAWCSIPVLVTLRALVEFIGIPAWRFAAGDDLLDSGYVQAMLLTLIGFVTFWAGSLALIKQTRLRFVPKVRDTPSRVALMSFVMLVLGLSGGAILWEFGLYSYTADAGIREASFGFVQWLGALSNLLNTALLV
jgi:hypothetical protein